MTEEGQNEGKPAAPGQEEIQIATDSTKLEGTVRAAQASWQKSE